MTKLKVLAKARAREARRQRFAVIGEALVIEAALDPELEARIIGILSRRVLSSKKRADLIGMFSRLLTMPSRPVGPPEA